MFPAAAEAFRQHLANMQTSGLSAEYRNLCVRKVQIVHVRNCADNSQDEFTARINAHAQLIVRRGNEVVKKDEDVRAFVEYWTFGRHGGSRWKLKEVQQEAAGRRLETAESVDEDGVLEQIQWQHR
jgi:predicted lipid-binding transport protein (Tim44 family)